MSEPTDDVIRIATLAAVKTGAKSDAEAVRNYREAERIIRAALPHLSEALESTAAELLYQTRTKDAALKGLGRYEKRLQKKEAELRQERERADTEHRRAESYLADLDFDQEHARVVAELRQEREKRRRWLREARDTLTTYDQAGDPR